MSALRNRRLKGLSVLRGGARNQRALEIASRKKSLNSPSGLHEDKDRMRLPSLAHNRLKRSIGKRGPYILMSQKRKKLRSDSLFVSTKEISKTS